jgi:hypothetical protein
MVRDHPYHEFTRWFAWYRVPVSDTKTAGLCWVERQIWFNGSSAFFTYRLPAK